MIDAYTNDPAYRWLEDENDRLKAEITSMDREQAAYEHEINTGRSEQHDRLESEVARLELAIRRWSAPTGAHRNCTCRLCEDLRAVLDSHPVARKDEG